MTAAGDVADIAELHDEEDVLTELRARPLRHTGGRSSHTSPSAGGMMQLDLFSWLDAQTPPPPPSPTAVLAARLVELGLVGVGTSRDRRFSISDWSAPMRSRMLQHPIIVTDGRLLLRHPDLRGADFVQRVADRTGVVPVWHSDAAPDRQDGEWWHALDLATDERHRDLMGSLNLTTRRDFCDGVASNVEGGELSVLIARKLLIAIGELEPGDRSRSLLAGVPASGGDLAHFHAPDAAAGAWYRIHAVEDGYVKRRGGNLWVTEKWSACIQ